MRWEEEGPLDRTGRGLGPEEEESLTDLAPIGILVSGQVCWFSVLGFSLDGEQVYKKATKEEAVVATNGEVAFYATYSSLIKIDQNADIVFERTEDFGQEVYCTTLDENGNVWIGFEDNFVRAYDDTPLRVRAGNVNLTPLIMGLDGEGRLAVAGERDGAYYLALWSNDLKTLIEEVSIDGEPVAIGIEPLDNEGGLVTRLDNFYYSLTTSENGISISSTALAEVPIDAVVTPKNTIISYTDGTLEVRDSGGGEELEFAGSRRGGYLAYQPREQLLRSPTSESPLDPPYLYFLDRRSGRLSKWNWRTKEKVWETPCPAGDISAYPGPIGPIYTKFLEMETSEEEKARVDVGLTTGIYRPIVITAESLAESADANVGLAAGSYVSIVITTEPLVESADASVGLQSGTYYAVVVSTEPLSETMDTSVGVSSGDYVFVVVDTGHTHLETMDASVSLQSGGYYAV